MPVLKVKDWPRGFQRYMCVRGIFVKGCVTRGNGSSFRAKAHAHVSPKDPYQGWICVRKASRVQEDRETMLHELAHLLTLNGHTAKFRAALEALTKGEMKMKQSCPPCLAASST